MARSPLFRGADEAVLEYAEELGVVKPLIPEDILIRKDEQNSRLFLILEGRVGIRLDRRRTFVELGPLECVGEMSMVDGSLSSADVVVLEPGRALELPKAAVWNLVNRSHAIACNLLHILTLRLRMGNAVTVEEAKKADQLALEAYSDPLTGLNNRRWLGLNFPRTIKRHLHQGKECTLLFFDVDLFKKVNDALGHQTGDEVLRRVAEITREVCRPTDLMVRYAGDEFAVLLPATYLDQGFQVAKRLVEATASDQGLGSLTGNLRVTLSVGVSSTRSNRDLESLLEAADHAMYRAKEFGRNRASL